MQNEIEDRIARAALAGGAVAGAIAIATFLAAGGVILNAQMSTVSLSFPPSSQGVVLGALLIAGLLKAVSRVASPTGRWLNGRA
ncbi:hypothetical protein BH10PSE4_BH10PSE4_01040 [soil metagenome]